MISRWISFLCFLGVLYSAVSIGAAASPTSRKLLGIRCGVDEACLERAAEMGLNAVLVNDSVFLEPEGTQYDDMMERLERVSRMAKRLDLELFVGWHVLGPQAVALAGGAKKDQPLCVSTGRFWDRVFAEPMERIARALSGPDKRLDGFLPDVENYTRRPVAWSGGCEGEVSRSLEEVERAAAETRRRVRSIHPGLAFGLYPVRANEGRDVFWAWARGLADPETPLMLLAEYTYSGYRPELELQEKIDAYENRVGNPVLLVPGFNVLKIPEPRAWGMHLRAFAEKAGGYWLYPGSHIVRGAPVGTHEAWEVFDAIREANAEIRRTGSKENGKERFEYRRTPPHLLDLEGFQELLELAGQVSAPAGVKTTPRDPETAILRTGDANLLVQADPESPIELSASGRGYLGVYDPKGTLLAMHEFDPEGMSLRLPVGSAGVYPVLVRVTDESRPAGIMVKSRFYSFRGVSTGTSGGRTARFLDRPAPGPFYFHVPERTPFFRVFMSDKTRGRFAVVRDPDGREALRVESGYVKEDREQARQDHEIPVPEGTDGRAWSVDGHPVLGLPRLVVYGVPDLFSSDASRLLTLESRAWAARLKDMHRRRTVSGPNAVCLWIEAEELWGGPWRLSRAFPGTSGKGAMFAKSFRSILPLYGEIEIPHEGAWSVWVHALAGPRDSKRRSARIRIGETLFEQTHTGSADSDRFLWESAGSAVLQEGVHILRVFPSPKGRPSIDAILLTDDARATPEACKAP